MITLVCLAVAALAIAGVALHLTTNDLPDREAQKWERFSQHAPIRVPPPDVRGLDSAQIIRALGLDGNRATARKAGSDNGPNKGGV